MSSTTSILNPGFREFLHGFSLLWIDPDDVDSERVMAKIEFAYGTVNAAWRGREELRFMTPIMDIENRLYEIDAQRNQYVFIKNILVELSEVTSRYFDFEYDHQGILRRPDGITRSMPGLRVRNLINAYTAGTKHWKDLNGFERYATQAFLAREEFIRQLNALATSFDVDIEQIISSLSLPIKLSYLQAYRSNFPRVSEISVNKNQPEVRPSYAVIALSFFYSNKSIGPNNASDIASSYGYNSETSGKKLLDGFRRVVSDVNHRIGCKNSVCNIEAAIQLLPHSQDRTRAQAELVKALALKS